MLDQLAEEKKLVKSILKQIISSAEFYLFQPLPDIPVKPFSVLVSVLQDLRPVLTSSKSISAVGKLFSEVKDTLKRIRENKELKTRKR